MDAIPEAMSAEELLQAHELLWSCTLSFIKPMSLKCAVDLDIPGVIHAHGKPVSLAALAAALPVHPSKPHFLRRLMRLLVHFGFFATDQDGHFSLTPASGLLLRGRPASLAPFVSSQLNPRLVTPWITLSAWLRSPDFGTPFEAVNGASLWECIEREPGFGREFTDAMTNDSHAVAGVVVEQCRGVFEGIASLVDVGGGAGMMAKAVAEAFPGIKCTVLELPYIVNTAQGSENVRFVAGDMFEAVPRANAVMLKWVLHDWNDDDALILLKRCHEAIILDKDNGGKMIIIDCVVGQSQNPVKSTETQICLDLLMMVHIPGKERDEKEWEALFYGAGFSRYKISPIPGARSLIEVYP